MATVVAIRGLSGRGFRVRNSAGAWVTVREGANTNVDLEMEDTQRILSRERDNFVRASGATALLQGLSRRGFRVRPFGGAATISNATPAVVGLVAHGLQPGDAVQFTTTGVLPDPLVVGRTYYVQTTGTTANAFRIALTDGGADINTTSGGSGTHTLVPNIKQVVFNRDAAVKVDLQDPTTKRAIKRQKRDFISVSAVDSFFVNVYGLLDNQASFRVTDSAANEFVFAGANNNISLVPLTPADDLSFAIVDKGVNNASIDIATDGNAIEVSLAVTQEKKATLSLADAGDDDNDILITSKIDGNAGEYIEVSVVKPPDTNVAVPLDVSVTGLGTSGSHYLVVISLEVDTDGSTVLSTANDVIAAIEATPAVDAIIGAELNTVTDVDNDGTGVVDYTAVSTALTGGDDYSIDSTSKDVVDAINADTGAGGSGLLVEPFYEGTGLGKPELVAPTILSGGPQPISQNETAVVDITDPFNAAQLRRHFRAWVEA